MNFAIKTVGLYGRINSNEKIVVTQNGRSRDPLFADPSILHWTFSDSHSAKAGYICIECQLSC